MKKQLRHQTKPVLLFLCGATLSATFSVMAADTPAAPTPPATAPAAAPAAPAGPSAVLGPRIKFDSTTFDFEKIVGGSSVRHDFIFTNVGDALLTITSVQPSCGCTTAADWSREVAPGAIGRIPLQFNSGNFSGTIAKTATVVCNDTNQASIVLNLKGTIWRPIEVNPQMAALNVNAETVSNATASVRVINNTPEPLAIFDPVSSNPQFAAEIRTNEPGKVFEITVRTVPPLNPANTYGTFTVKTSFTNSPVVNFTAMCMVQPSVTIIPPRLVVREASLTNQTPVKVNIRSGLSQPLVLSNATLTVPGGSVELVETEKGKAYELSVIVPAAVKDAPPNQAELTLNSNFGGHETIRVPISMAGANLPQAIATSPLPPRSGLIPPRTIPQLVPARPPTPTVAPAPAPAPAPATPTHDHSTDPKSK